MRNEKVVLSVSFVALSGLEVEWTAFSEGWFLQMEVKEVLA